MVKAQQYVLLNWRGGFASNSCSRSQTDRTSWPFKPSSAVVLHDSWSRTM